MTPGGKHLVLPGTCGGDDLWGLRSTQEDEIEASAQIIGLQRMSY